MAGAGLGASAAARAAPVSEDGDEEVELFLEAVLESLNAACTRVGAAGNAGKGELWCCAASCQQDSAHQRKVLPTRAVPRGQVARNI